MYKNRDKGLKQQGLCQLAERCRGEDSRTISVQFIFSFFMTAGFAHCDVTQLSKCLSAGNDSHSSPLTFVLVADCEGMNHPQTFPEFERLRYLFATLCFSPLSGTRLSQTTADGLFVTYM